MKTNVSRTLLVIAMMLIGAVSASAQKGVEDGSKYGHGKDSIRALQNLSMYKQFYKQKSYNDAIKSWRIVFNEAPKISKNMYIHGVNMYKIFYKKSKSADERKKFVDSILMVYDQRIEYFGHKGSLLARKGVDLNNMDPSRRKEAYDMLHQSIDILGNKTPDFALNELMQASLSLYKDEVITKDEMVNNFSLCSDIVDKQIEACTDPTKRERAETVKANVELIFTKSGAADCETLTPLLTEKYNEKPEDVENLKKIVGLLRTFDCESSDIFQQSAESLYKLEPNANAAYSLARVFLKKRDWDKAIDYYTEAVDNEEDSLTKARYNRELAEILLAAERSPAKAVSHALQSLKYEPGNGKAYLIIGQAYANAKNFGENKFEARTVYWVAVDMFYKAKTIDPSVEGEANKLIGTYSQYFPNKEDAFFYNVTEGSTYQVKGWINRTTTARF